MPPQGYCCQQVQTYNVKKDNRCLCGYGAIADFHSLTKCELKARQLCMATPPGAINPPSKGGQFHPLPLAGCVQACLGLLMAHTINGDLDNIVTFWGCQTLESLKKILALELCREFHRHAVSLACSSWGCPEMGSRWAHPQFCTHKGLKQNNRSAKNLPPGSFDGSYKLVSIVGKGEGQGCVFPAVQIDTPEGTVQIKEILEDLAFLGDAALQATLSHFEYDATQFHSKDNNIFGFRGLKPYTMSCQVNISLCTTNLSQSIGKGQGSWHADRSNDWTHLTIGMMLICGLPGMLCMTLCWYTCSHFLSGSE
jgi:hypothetical protein